MSTTKKNVFYAWPENECLLARIAREVSDGVQRSALGYAVIHSTVESYLRDVDCAQKQAHLRIHNKFLHLYCVLAYTTWRSTSPDGSGTTMAAQAPSSMPNKNTSQDT